jgi:hypothetical protein
MIDISGVLGYDVAIVGLNASGRRAQGGDAAWEAIQERSLRHSVGLGLFGSEKRQANGAKRNDS